MSLNIRKSSLQRIYEFALRHRRKQQRPGTIAENSTACAYRGPNGLKCAVGAMLTDEQMQEYGIDNKASVTDGAEEAFKKLIGADRTGKKFKLLSEIQMAHDRATVDYRAGGSTAFMAQIERKFEQVAQQFGLTYKAPGTTLRA